MHLDPLMIVIAILIFATLVIKTIKKGLKIIFTVVLLVVAILFLFDKL